MLKTAVRIGLAVTLGLTVGVGLGCGGESQQVSGDAIDQDIFASLGHRNRFSSALEGIELTDSQLRKCTEIKADFEKFREDQQYFFDLKKEATEAGNQKNRKIANKGLRELRTLDDFMVDVRALLDEDQVVLFDAQDNAWVRKDQRRKKAGEKERAKKLAKQPPRGFTRQGLGPHAKQGRANPKRGKAKQLELQAKQREENAAKRRSAR